MCKVQLTLNFLLYELSLVIDERNLEAIAAQEGYNCQELTELVRENESILDGMKVRQLSLSLNMPHLMQSIGI